MELVGYAKKIGVFGSVSSKAILSDYYEMRIDNLKETATHLFQSIDPFFVDRLIAGDFIIAGHNFGYGSVQETPIFAMKALGIQGIIAKSFAWHFKRNAINHGFLVLEANTDYIMDRDKIEVHLEEGVIRNLTRRLGVKLTGMDDFDAQVYQSGGLVPYYLHHQKST